MVQIPSPKRHPYAQWAPDARALDLVGDKWTLLIVRDLLSGRRRFVELQRVLPGISTEQLRSRLNRMVADGLLTRKRYREVPPRVDYELTERARDLVPVLAEIARWGYRWAWSVPRAGERVDIGAIFRLTAGLVQPQDATRTLALTVTDGGRDAEPVTFTLTTGPGGADVCEATPDSGTDATASGTRSDWVRALSPACDSSGLTLSGDAALAAAVLSDLGQFGVQADEFSTEAERVA
jgi:DNA-binding HxlR family transcriptional regulator